MTRLLTILVFALAALGCENPASSGTIDVTLRNVSAVDVDPRGGLLFAVASINTGACVEGPCSPNPCLDDPQGKTTCRGQGDQYMCVCPAGTHEDTESGTGACVPDTQCATSTCNRRAAGTCTSEGGVLSCTCEVGFTGPNCTECDASAGSFPDGLGFCTMTPGELCREGQGTEAFRALLAEAEEELGHPPTELELASASMEITGMPQGVRAWDYLFRDEVTLVLQSVSGFPLDAGTVRIRERQPVTDVLEFDMRLTRADISADPLFQSGDFRVGISGPSDRQLTEMFSADIKLSLRFNTY